MKKSLVTLITASSLLLMGCSEEAPSVEELVKNNDLFEKIESECKALGDKEKQFKIKKCINMHKAADKKRTIVKEFPSILG